MATAGANKDKSPRPEGLIIQELDPDCTNAAFVQRLIDAEGHFLYARLNELDQFDALKGNGGTRQEHFRIICLAFDPDNRYGQTRVSERSVSGSVCGKATPPRTTSFQISAAAPTSAGVYALTVTVIRISPFANGRRSPPRR